MTTLAERWAGMRGEAKAAWHRPAEAGAEGPALPPPAAPAVPALWPGCSDEFYPVSAANLGDVPSAVRKLAADWHCTVPNQAVRPRVVVEAQASRTCCDIWGRGRCEAQIDAGQQAAIASCKSRMRVWGSFGKVPEAKFDELWQKVSLFFIGRRLGGVAGSAEEDLRGLGMLLVSSEGNPASQLFFANRFPVPNVGDTLRFTDLSLQSFLDDNDIARTLMVTSLMPPPTHYCDPTSSKYHRRQVASARALQSDSIRVPHAHL